MLVYINEFDPIKSPNINPREEAVSAKVMCYS